MLIRTFVISVLMTFFCNSIVAQDNNCFDNLKWQPETNLPATYSEIEILGAKVIVSYRTYIDDNNKIVIEKIEFANEFDLENYISTKENNKNFFDNLSYQLLRNIANSLKWNAIDDTTKVLNLEIIKKVYWQAIQKNKVYIPCNLSKCFYQYINVVQIPEQAKVTKKEFHPENKMFYGLVGKSDKDCFSIVTDE